MPDAPTPMTRIDRLRIVLPGGDVDHSRKVAKLVAAGLANAGALPQAGDIPTLRVTLTADHRADPETLARLIVAATLRDLARTP
jgi:hypothetical protein